MNQILDNFKARTIIFDLDGTLVDSALDFNAMRTDIGMPKDVPILEYLEAHNDPVFLKEALSIVHRHELKGAKESTPIKDIENFLNVLKQKRIPTGIVTRNSREITELTLKKHNWSFDYVISRDCAPAKPNPKGLLGILNSMNISPDSAFFVGDSKHDLDTANNAKVKFVLILNQNNKNLIPYADITIEKYSQLYSYL